MASVNDVALRIVNTVFSAKLSKCFNLKEIHLMYINKLSFNPKKFSGLIFPIVLSRPKHESKKHFLERKSRQGRGKVLLFANGKLIVSGCLSDFDARRKVSELVRTIGIRCELIELKLLNVVVSGSAGTTLPLDTLFNKLNHWKSLEYELFPALIVRRNNISFTLFRSGKYFATGLKSFDEVKVAQTFFEHIHKIVKRQFLPRRRVQFASQQQVFVLEEGKVVEPVLEPAPEKSPIGKYYRRYKRRIFED